VSHTDFGTIKLSLDSLCNKGFTLELLLGPCSLPVIILESNSFILHLVYPCHYRSWEHTLRNLGQNLLQFTQ
jgi:hypothetical protein